MTRRLKTLYRIMYASFTPGMMRRTPLWLKRRIARALEYELVDRLDPNEWLALVVLAKPGELTPISIAMFESCVGGSSIRPFFRLSCWIQSVIRIWKGEPVFLTQHIHKADIVYESH